ncbi:MAG: MerR family transcriptional regulator [Ruminococcus sp.]|jgi:DNA-binding transcriptional MerR regulator
MKNLFTIGEMAQLFNLNTKTLRYYHEIGLLVPEETDKRTGYRYYSTRQFERLNTILYLRALQIPLENIALFFRSKDRDTMINLLKEQQQKIRKTIQDMLKIEKKLDVRLQQLTEASRKKTGIIEEKCLGERHIIYLKKEIPVTDDLEYPIRELEKIGHFQSSVFLGKIGVSIDRSSLLSHDFSAFSGIFILTEQEEELCPETALAPGLWLTLCFSGTHTQAEPYYHKLLSYIDREELTVSGDAVEITLIDYGMTDNTEQFMTEIQIPVGRKIS